MPNEGKKNILAICPGFSSDCVETLEKFLFKVKKLSESGGENFDMVPCLNDNDDHIALLKTLVQKPLIYEYLLAFQIFTLNSSYFDGRTLVPSTNFCLPFGNDNNLQVTEVFKVMEKKLFFTS